MKSSSATGQFPRRLYTLFIIVCGGLPLTTNAAPGSLEQVPLFTVNSAKPNILFVTDDSTSMKGDIMTTDSLLTSAISGGTPTIVHRVLADSTICNYGTDDDDGDGEGEGYRFFTELTKDDRDWGSYIKPCDHAAEEEWRIRDYTFNTIYYNPNRSYKPWQGVDNNGQAFSDMTISAARLDPYEPSKTIDLLTESALLSDNRNASSRDYYTQTAWLNWCLSNSITGTCEGWRYYYYTGSTRQLKWANELNAAERTNFANWFTYHRSREYAAKYALSVVISNTENSRIGYMPINNYASYAVPVNTVTDAHRANILSQVLSTPSSVPKTPLRTALIMAGDYYENGNSSINTGFQDSPIQNSTEGGNCAVNSTILMTDGFYNDSDSSISISDADGDASSDYDRGPNHDSGHSAHNPYADDYPRTLADIAMHYYETDLSSTNDNSVKNPDYNNPIEALRMDNELMHQSMRTFVISFGLNGTLDPDGTKTTTTTDTNFYDSNFVGWPKPNTDPKKLDDLWHAAVNGRGTFVNATSAGDLIEALKNAVGNITGTIGSSTQVAFSAFRLDDNSSIYYSHFETNNWGGEFIARKIDSNGVIDDEIWQASEVLREDSNRVSNRVILTYDEDNGTGISFQWNSLTPTQRAKLNLNFINDASLSDSQRGQARINYLRGDSSNESSTGYRKRDIPNNTSGDKNYLGDIVHSSPTYVGAPGLFYPDATPFGINGKRYSDFWDETKDRDPIIYVGANDGMLHGFDAATGTERLAYVPNAVFDNLSDLIDPNYSHRYFVDGSPTVADAYFAKGGSANWRTVLVGGLGAGGKGWYALDITEPTSSNFRESNADNIVLWEFGADNSDVGYSLSRPIIALTNASDSNGKRWAMITGNGYNAYNGIAKLFIVYLDANPSGGWTPSDDYVVLTTGEGSAGNKNGLSSPVGADVDGDGTTDRIYAGDLEGNMWVFDISNENPSEWGLAYNNDPLFTASNAAGDIQPITAAPTLARNSDQSTNLTNSPNILVYFGTGQYLNTNDLSNKETQTFYAIWDQGQQAELTPTNLTEQTIDTLKNTSTSGNNPVTVDARLTSNNYVLYGDTSNNQRFGWKLDLLDPDPAKAEPGERVVTQALVRDDIVFFSTFTPNNDPCEVGGTTWFMFLDATTGGLPNRPVVDLNRDNKVDDNDKVGASSSNPGGLRVDGTVAPIAAADSIVALHNLDLNSESGEVNIIRINTGTGNTNSRLSWQELRRQ